MFGLRNFIAQRVDIAFSELGRATKRGNSIQKFPHQNRVRCYHEGNFRVGFANVFANPQANLESLAPGEQFPKIFRFDGKQSTGQLVG